MVVRAADGEIINVKSWLPTLTMGDLHALRPKLRLRNSAELFLCFCCGHEVLLRKHMQGGHFFAHKEKTSAERSHCIYQQDHVISEADRDRIRYHGQREGERHKKAKALIARVIAADSNFSPPEIEKTWTTFEDGWRRPDVSSTWHDQRIVFEAQISNTYPQVVAERTSF
jgi:competence CoiA-like predicted nuclease